MYLSYLRGEMDYFVEIFRAGIALISKFRIGSYIGSVRKITLQSSLQEYDCQLRI